MTTPRWTPPTTTPTVPWCEIRPPQWWDTGNKDNHKALALCNVCPFKATCKDDNKPTGVIRAGVPYDYDGHATRICDRCYHPKLTRFGRRHTCPTGRPLAADHHHRIMALREARYSWPAIGQATGLDPEAARSYWTRWRGRPAPQRREPAEPAAV